MSMGNREDEIRTGNNRRGFLRAALTAGTGMAVVAVVPKAMASTSLDGNNANTAQQGKKGYHVTPHIIDYYKSASF